MKKSTEILKTLFSKNYRYIESKLYPDLKRLKNASRIHLKKNLLTNEDVILIIYGDNFVDKHEKPLKTLKKFLEKYVYEKINYIHILPFFPYSSDDGFSVIDYRKVNPELGNWNDIKNISKNFSLMFDFVLNHISSKNLWFKKFLEGSKKYTDYFICPGPECDISKVVRSRSHPLLTEFKKKNGETVKVWTTFSPDQIDLNYKNPEVFIEMTKIFLYYLFKRAKIIRLDAVAYLWKKCGTRCIHLKETHLYIKYLRALIDELKSDCIILTETNVPHKENVSYFGKGDEAHMVYQFPLPPLLAHTIIRCNLTYFYKWLKSLPSSEGGKYFLNFTASHDGVGIRPLSGLVPDSEISFLIKKAKERGGLVSYKSNSDGSKSPYELNITYLDLINPPNSSVNEKVKRFIVSQFIMLSLKGVPAVYIHSLIGSQNYSEGVKITGKNRTINREKLNFAKFEKEMKTNLLRKEIYDRYSKLLEIRRKEKAFHPDGIQKIIEKHPKVFSLLRIYKGSKILCIANISEQSIDMKKTFLYISRTSKVIDLISQKEVNLRNLKLLPFDIMWLKLS